MHDIFQTMGRVGIVPVVTLTDATVGVPIAEALAKGGIPVMEVTLRTSEAIKGIEQIAKAGLNILLGAGTVLTTEQAESALDAGARFIVSPGYNRKLVQFCLKRNVAVLPGVLTPTEIIAALEDGLDVVKIFPAQAAGGVDFLKAVSAPFPSVRFIPTGGIDATNLIGYLREPSVIAVGGSWMVKKEFQVNKAYAEITAMTSLAVKSISSLGRVQFQ